MPLRRWMTEHGHPAWYSWLVVIGGCITTLLASVAISISVSNKALEREEQARLKSEQATCAFAEAFISKDSEPSPTTEYGRRLEERIAHLRTTLQCPPIKQKD